MHNKEKLIEDLKNIGIKNQDHILIHSSFKSLNIKDPNTFFDALENVIDDGLIVFPTHTWAIIREDLDVFDKFNTPSNVGYLTNVALKRGYIRSNHPTHSVCAKGNDSEKFIHLDDNSKTPCDPSGCHGYFKNHKILFLGAPLSKNTFIHSVEEEMNVPDRFTSHTYHFISKGEKNLDFNVKRHYNEKCPHISDNYEKLLPFLLDLKIAKYGKIGDSDSYLLDGYKLNEFVKFLLSKDIHIFDDLREIDKSYIKEYKEK